MKTVQSDATDEQCIALYMALHVSQLHGLPPAVVALWERGQAAREAKMAKGVSA